MCGIFGVVGQYDEQAARRSLDTLAPRGTDGIDFDDGDAYFFGQTRLAIMDLEQKGGVYADGVARLVFNGEIYNYRQLASELRISSSPFSEGDVILKGLLRDGSAFLSQLRGMFALAFWDGQRLLLARDAIGKKPLFYSLQDGSFVFASEIKAILPYVKNKTISREGLNGFFGFLSPLAPYTIFENIFRLNAGELLELEDGKIFKSRFDTPLVQVQEVSRDEAMAKTRELFFESLGLRLSAGVEIGSLLSGGLDSALILAAATNIHGKRLRTFTVGYEGYDSYDERSAARQSAGIYGSMHTEFSFSKSNFFESLERFTEYMDEPLNDPASLPLDYLMQRIREQGIKCVLSGEGSDEQYYGYGKYDEYAKFEAMRAAPFKGWLKNYFEQNIAYNKEWEWYLRVFRDEPVYRGYGENFLDSQRGRLLLGNARPSMPFLSDVVSEFEAGGGGDYWRWASFVDLRVWLDEVLLHKVDRVSMANGVEVRAPFLDSEFLTHSLSIPSIYKIPTSPKSFLKEAFADILPPAITGREKKGFSYPFMEWLREDGDMDIVRRVAAETGLFSMKNIEFYLKPRKDKGFRHHLWGLYIFSKWYEKQFL
jgi:asparagine synthase (glutamine-hydrolysing)